MTELIPAATEAVTLPTGTGSRVGALLRWRTGPSVPGVSGFEPS